MNKTKGFWVQAKNKKAEIFIYETIGDGWLGGISAKTFAKELKGAGNADEIDVYISSDGGSVFDGVSIYNQLKRHPARVTTHIDGIAASIASVIAMAGDEIFMAANAQMMIHKAWTVTGGNADELRKQADILDKIDEETIVATYANRSGMEVAEILDLLSDETWMSADDAKEYGFIDGITSEVKMAAHYDLSRFKNVPDSAVDLMNKFKEPEAIDITDGGGFDIPSDWKRAIMAAVNENKPGHKWIIENGTIKRANQKYKDAEYRRILAKNDLI